ncbi:TetR/AcrR family transcriptional regulator [Streptomyces sp. NRRL B-1347]|uniref:TetR/AcrR family transcriptional regulator n=1 Tax=Streptomyces sp. NRRL B-1347 TaxID=1476877 RepID=UPI0004C9B2A0|nr:TetR/AcrR family transcriptional regulator [Streptomyces sp. NRRL B-1347]
MTESPGRATATPATATPRGRAPRADAVRNRERIVAAAREAFAEAGPEASLNDIARRAGVGPGTLYRNFSGRSELLAAVLKDRIDTLCGRADDLLTADSPYDALTEWLHAFLVHARVNQGIGGTLLLEQLEESGALGIDCHQRVHDAVAGLLTRAQRAGAARPDLSPSDLLHLVVGIALSTACPGGSAPEDPQRPERLLGLVLDTVRTR